MAEKNPFVILGVSENCTQSELNDAYESLRKKYSDLRFEAGEVGAEACEKLDEIEEAYAKAKDILQTNYNIQYTGSDLSDVDTAVKEGRLEDAQRILDDCAERTARWHYLQSAVFYRKGWVEDALKQLEFACQMDPENADYAEAKKTMSEKLNADSSTKRSFYNDQTADGRSYRNMEEGTGRSCGVCDCCTTLLCVDCCCECFGGDLIACC